MPSLIKAAARHRKSLLVSTFLASVIFVASLPARAQQVAAALPPIEVKAPPDDNRTRGKPKIEQEQGSRRAVPSTAPTSKPNVARTAKPNTAPAGESSAPQTPNAAAVGQFNGITGASSSVITAEDIAHSPAQTLPEIIAQTPGVQLTSLFGGVNGARTSVDLRGFGAFATANTLVLINGRRLNDIDMAQVDLSTIPLNSIERIEITRGNSGGVLTGDIAVGAVTTTLPKTGVGGPPVAIRGEAGVGSFNTRLANVSASANYGPWSTSFYGNAVKSDGYRDNNQL